MKNLFLIFKILILTAVLITYVPPCFSNGLLSEDMFFSNSEEGDFGEINKIDGLNYKGDKNLMGRDDEPEPRPRPRPPKHGVDFPGN